MLGNDKERLIEGKSTSDEAIEADVERLRRQIHGLPEPEIVIEGELLSPKPIAPTTLSQSAESIVEQGQLNVPTNLKPTDSGFGNLLLITRRSKIIKKAA